METIASNLRAIRERRGLTQQQLADTSGVSVETIRHLEQHPDVDARMDTLRRLAAPLRVHTSDLLRAAPPTIEDASAMTTSLLGMRAVLTPAPRLAGTPIVADIEPPTLDELIAATQLAARAYHKGSYADLLSSLPGLIRDGQVAVRTTAGRQRDLAYTVLGTGLRVAGRALKQVKEHDLSATALDQAIDAAERGGDLPGAARGISMQADVYMRLRRYGDAVDMCVRAADVLHPGDAQRGDMPLVAAWGCLLRSASAAAARDSRGETDDLLSEMNRAADLITTEAWDAAEAPGSRGEFGANAARMMVTECAVIRGDLGTALATAKTVTPGAVSPSTRDRHMLDVAAASARSGKPRAAEKILGGLARRSPTWLARQHYGQEITAELVDGHRRLPPEMVLVADLVGLPV